MWAKKILEFFEVLEPKELEELELYLHSPYFNRGVGATSVLDLFALFKDAYESNTWPDQKSTYQRLFPNEPKIEGKLPKLVNQLTKSIRGFIQIHDWDGRKIDNQPSIEELRFYFQRGLNQRLESGIDKRVSFLENKQNVDAEALHKQFLLEQLRVEYFSSINNRRNDLNIPKLLEQLDEYYLFSKMEFNLAFIAQGTNLSLPQDHFEALLVEIQQLPGDIDFWTIPVVRIYREMLAFLILEDGGSLEKIEAIRLELKQADKHLLLEQKQLLVGLLRQQVINKVNQGEIAFLPIAFQIYKEHLDAGFLKFEGLITPSTYRNMVTMSLRMKEFAWTRKFLEDYRNKIIGVDHPEEIYQFNLANLYFYERKFDLALDTLGPKYHDLYYQMAARRLEIKILYETDSPILDSKMEAFKVYIYRLSQKRLPEVQALGNNHFIDLLRRIVNPATLGNESRINVLRNQFSAVKILAERNWLGEKLQEL